MDLTEQEQRIVDYHRNSIRSGNVGSDEKGRPITVYSTGILIRSGPNAGKYVSVPGWVGGKLIRSEDRLAEIWKKEIDAGKWPMYSSGAELNKRSQEIHTIMDAEETEAVQSRTGAQELLRRPNPGSRAIGGNNASR